MTVPRVLVSDEQLAAGHVELSGEKAHYLCRVLRLRRGDHFRVFTARGDELEAEITQIGYRRVSARLLGPVEEPDADPKHSVCVALAVLKGRAMDWAVQKLAEVGAQTIIPVISERVVVTLRDAEGKGKRWQQIAFEAARQSRRRRMPEVLPVASLTQVRDEIGKAAQRVWLLLDPDARDAVSVPEALAEAQSAALIVGPEGDLTDDEKQSLTDAGAKPVYLGPRILRAETAAVVACALALYALGELGPPGRPPTVQDGEL